MTSRRQAAENLSRHPPLEARHPAIDSDAERSGAEFALGCLGRVMMRRSALRCRYSRIPLYTQ